MRTIATLTAAAFVALNIGCGSDFDWSKIEDTAVALRDAACDVWGDEITELPDLAQTAIGCGGKPDAAAASGMVGGSGESANPNPYCQASRIILDSLDQEADEVKAFRSEYESRCG